MLSVLPVVALHSGQDCSPTGILAKTGFFSMRNPCPSKSSCVQTESIHWKVVLLLSSDFW